MRRRNWAYAAHMSQRMTKPTKWHVRPAKTQISLAIRADAQADQRLHWAHMPFGWFCHALAHMPLCRFLFSLSCYGQAWYSIPYSCISVPKLMPFMLLFVL